MASLEPFLCNVKPALDSFLRLPNENTLGQLHRELEHYHWKFDMTIYHSRILVPLVLKLYELDGYKEELRTGTINAICLVTSKLFLNDVKGLSLILVVALRQIQEMVTAKKKLDVSEEMKLAAIQCISVSLERSATDVLESFYTDDSITLLGKILIALVEFIESENYRKIILNSILCIQVVFYVHDKADFMDLVLRNQVANMLFLYLPKIVTVLYKISLAEDKIGDTLKSAAIKALGRVLWIIYDENNIAELKSSYSVVEFKNLIEGALVHKNDNFAEDDVLLKRIIGEDMDKRMKRKKSEGRTPQWITMSSRRLRVIFAQTRIFRIKQSAKLREEYAEMCCQLLKHCAMNLKENFLFILESIVVMSEDVDDRIRRHCKSTLRQLQENSMNIDIFDINCEIVFDEHLTKLPRIIHRCEDEEQYVAFTCLKAFLVNLSSKKLQSLLQISKNLEMLCMCLISTVSLKATSHLLVEDSYLSKVCNADISECKKLNWRQFQNLSTSNCIDLVHEICGILGEIKVLNRIVFDYLMDLFLKQHQRMNEIMLIMLWMATPRSEMNDSFELVNLLLSAILNEIHWNLAINPYKDMQQKPDKVTIMSICSKSTTSVLYGSEVEIKTQDFDSDDETDHTMDYRKSRITIRDVQFNILHTCMALDVLGHCSMFLGDSFDAHIFQSLPNILLKVASSNYMIYQAATFCLVSMQKALKFMTTSDFITTYMDFITYHTQRILKKAANSKSAVDILSVVLQFYTPSSLPHLDNILMTICDECAKIYQSDNINSYLNVFHAFLKNLDQWQKSRRMEVDSCHMHLNTDQKTDYYVIWLDVLKNPITNLKVKTNFQEQTKNETNHKSINTNTNETGFYSLNNQLINIPHNYGEVCSLPRTIKTVIRILNQVLKFVTYSEKCNQILALDCLIVGLPLLQENELLPLVHTIWRPIVEKFRQQEPIILHRCCTLLDILATHSKDFILKRSLDDVIPFLKEFLEEKAVRSARELSSANTQERKLQSKLLDKVCNLIQSMNIDGKSLNEIAEVITLYLSDEQPNLFQVSALRFCRSLRFYNGPLTYLIVLKKLHLQHYKMNANKLLLEFGIRV